MISALYVYLYLNKLIPKLYLKMLNQILLYFVCVSMSCMFHYLLLKFNIRAHMKLMITTVISLQFHNTFCPLTYHHTNNKLSLH